MDTWAAKKKIAKQKSIAQALGYPCRGRRVEQMQLARWHFLGRMGGHDNQDIQLINLKIGTNPLCVLSIEVGWGYLSSCPCSINVRLALCILCRAIIREKKKTTQVYKTNKTSCNTRTKLRQYLLACLLAGWPDSLDVVPIRMNGPPGCAPRSELIMSVDIIMPTTILPFFIRWLSISPTASPRERDALRGSDDITRLIVLSPNSRVIPPVVIFIIIIGNAPEPTKERVDVNRYRRPAEHGWLPAGMAVLLIVVLVILFLVLVVAQDPWCTTGGGLQIVLVKGPRRNPVRVSYVFAGRHGRVERLAHHFEQCVEPAEHGGGRWRSGGPFLVVSLVRVLLALLVLLIREPVLKFELVLEVVFTTI